MNKQTLIDEAVRRLKLLKVSQSVINSFLSGDIPSSFEMTKDDLAVIRKIEEKYKSVICYALKADLCDIGKVSYYLYVCRYTEDWKADREYTRMMCPIVIAYAPEWLPGDHIEFGSIYIAMFADHIVLADKNFRH